MGILTIISLSLAIYFLFGFGMIIFIRIYDPITRRSEWNETCAFLFWPILFFYYIGFFIFHEDRGILPQSATRVVGFIQKDRTRAPVNSPAPKERNPLKQCDLED